MGIFQIPYARFFLCLVIAIVFVSNSKHLNYLKAIHLVITSSNQKDYQVPYLLFLWFYWLLPLTISSIVLPLLEYKHAFQRFKIRVTYSLSFSFNRGKKVYYIILFSFVVYEGNCWEVKWNRRSSNWLLNFHSFIFPFFLFAVNSFLSGIWTDLSAMM